MVKEPVDFRKEVSGRGDGAGLARLLEQALASAGIVETLEGLPEAVLGECETKVAGSDLLDCVSLVEDHKVIRKEITASLLLGLAEQGEEEGVIEDEKIGRLGTATGRLVEAPRFAAAGFWCAEVLFAADLHPKFPGWFEREVAEGAVGSRRRPFADALELWTFLCCEEIRSAAAGSRKAGGADVVLATLKENGLYFLAQQSGGERDVLVEELFLQVDGVGAHECLAA